MKPRLSQTLLRAETEKGDIVAAVKQMISDLRFTIVDDMSDKPWGAGYRFADVDLKPFLKAFYADDTIDVQKGTTMSPKILVIAPKSRLSWQYHYRRAELWKIFVGPVGTIRSSSDREGPVEVHETGALVECACEQRHRIVGLDNWAVIAEIWQHTDLSHPSKEEDIVRISDDFGREGTASKA
ncbi:MAG: phosphoheptose isomerase [bacterium]|nr:phosphoheptose isomerase [bacterium]